MAATNIPSFTAPRATSLAVRLRRLRNLVAGTDGTGATVVMTLRDAAGAAVTNATALPLTLVAGTVADYAGVIPGTLTVTVGAPYLLEVTATVGGYTRLWPVRVVFA
jgi:hypothetical protein